MKVGSDEKTGRPTFKDIELYPVKCMGTPSEPFATGPIMGLIRRVTPAGAGIPAQAYVLWEENFGTWEPLTKTWEPLTNLSW